MGGAAVQSSEFINREVLPYGETSFGSFGRKAYRWTALEMDEESGLTYHRSRYFCCTSSRFLSTDRVGAEEGLNLYAYTSNNPIIWVDRTGQGEGEPDWNMEVGPYEGG